MPSERPRCVIRARCSHPDQNGLRAGEARVAVSLRAIGEGHVSSLGFAAGVVGPGARWTFEPRESPVVAGVSAPARWAPRMILRAVLADEGQVDDLTHNVLAGLPDVFTASEVQQILTDAHPDCSPVPAAWPASKCYVGLWLRHTR